MKKSFLVGALLLIGTAGFAQEQATETNLRADNGTKLTKQTAKKLQVTAVTAANVSEKSQTEESSLWKPIGEDRKKSANGKKLKEALRTE